MSGSWNSALSKVEFIVTGAAITMFFVKLVLLLYLLSVVLEVYFGMQLYVDGFVTMVSSRQILFFLFLTFSSSPSNFTLIANNIIVGAFSIFSNMI